LLDWLISMGVDRYDLAIIRFGNDNPAGSFIPGCTNLDRSGLERSLPWLRHENSRTAGVYFRPARDHSWPLVFLDDVTLAEAQRHADAYSAALIETSPDRLHVWLAMNQPLNEHERYLAQVKLAKRIGADMGSVSGEHWGRLPGFKNRKPGKDGWVNLRRLSGGQPCSVSLGLNGIAGQPDDQESHRPRQVQNSEIDQSTMEWKFVRSALEAGVPPNVVHQQLLERCAGRRGSDARRYAELTMRKACAKGGITFR